MALLALSAPLRAAIPDNDNFATRTRLSGSNLFVTGSNVDSTQEPGEPDPSFWGGKSVWWTWTAPTNGAVTITTAGSSFDTMLSVFTGNTLATLNLVAFNDTEMNTSSVTFNVTRDTVYQIMVDGALNAIGDISLQLTLGPTQPPPINDHFANRITLSGTHITSITANNVGATREAGEPYHADNVGLKSVWWTWTAPASGGLTLTTQGSSIDTVLAIYTGNSVSTLTFVAGNDESLLNPNGLSLLTCNVTAGTIYQIAVDGFEGDAGGIKMRLDLGAAYAVPPNDSFANRATLSGSDVTVSGTNVGASFEAIGADFEQGEPMHLVTFGGHSVWWTWTAPSSGGVTVTTLGLSTSGFELDTIAVVYTGNQLGNLQFVAGNDEDYLTTPEGDSRVRFNATGGTTYQIAVDGYDGDVGTINLHLLMETALTVPANNNFASRTSISGSNVNVLGANRGATLESGEPLHNHSYGGKSVWWTWTSPGPGFVTMDTVSSSNSFPETYFDTILAVYTGSTLGGLIPMASDDESGGNYLSVVRFPTRSGVTYQIAVDGYDGDFGDVNLHVAFTSASYSLSVSTNPIAGGTVTVNPAPNEGANYAPGTVVTLTAVARSGATFTSWSGSISSTQNPVAITMNGNKSIVAEFAIIPTTPTTRVWNGSSSANGNWTTSQNWNEGTPNAGDALIFPAGASRLANNNDFAANTSFRSITFGGANYVLSGNAINLNEGIIATNNSGTNTVNFAIQLNSNQTFRCAVPSTKLIIAGNVALGSRTFTADTAGELALSGIISGAGGLLKTNAGTLTLSGDNTFTGATTINAGRLNVNGSQPASPVVANAAGTLGGTGRVGMISGSGTVSPGSSPGVLVSSNVIFSGSSTFRVELNGSTAGPGYDQLSVTGAVTVAGTLNATLGYSPGTNDSFTIVNNDGNDPIVGSFNGLSEGSLFSIGDSQFRISYRAGPGANDVRLTYVVPPQITCPPNISTNTALGLCSRTVAFAANVTGAPVPTVSYKLGGVSISSPHSFAAGTNVVVVTATNGVPPDASCSFTVIVTDRERPAIQCPSNITVTAAGACPKVISFSQNTFATDNCSLWNLIASPASGSAFPVGTNVVRVTATDTAGNTNFCSFLVTVLPGPAPNLAIGRSGNFAVVLSWPASNGCYQLQSTAALITSPGSNAWTTFSGPRATNGGFIYVTNSAPTSNKFYRLLY